MANGNIILTVPIFYLPRIGPPLLPLLANLQQRLAGLRDQLDNNQRTALGAKSIPPKALPIVFSPPDYGDVTAFETALPNIRQLVQSPFPFISNIQAISAQGIPGFAITFNLLPESPYAPLIEHDEIVPPSNLDMFVLSFGTVRSLCSIFDSIFYKPQDSAWEGIIGTYFLIPNAEGAPPDTTHLSIGEDVFHELVWLERSELRPGGILGSGGDGN